MSWPLGYGKQEITYRTRAGGVLLADGAEVTAADGWIDIASLPSALAQGAPVMTAVQVRLRLDAHGRPYLFAGAVRTPERQYNDAHGLDTPWASAYLGSLADAVHAAIARRMNAASRAQTVPARRSIPAPSRSMPRVVAPDVTRPMNAIRPERPTREKRITGTEGR